VKADLERLSALRATGRSGMRAPPARRVPSRDNTLRREDLRAKERVMRSPKVSMVFFGKDLS
jgi:hypothetical protein